MKRILRLIVNADTNKKPEPLPECVICLETVSCPFKSRRCAHSFCTCCIVQWAEHHETSCPTCRQPDVIDLQTWTGRLQTFQSWNESVDGEAISKCGYYYTGKGDIIGCSFCRKEFSIWGTEEDTFISHPITPYCNRIRRRRRREQVVPLQTNEEVSDIDFLLVSSSLPLIFSLYNFLINRMQ